VNPRYIKPFDKEMILDLAGKYDKIITVEEGVLNGGFGMMINEFLSENDYKGKVRCFGIDDRFVEHGSVSELRKMLKIDGESIADSIRQWMKE
jgi:1-deoxy-D-xylulose-5-phosphate synthase